MPQRHRLKLFLSADIIGSTSYKQPFPSGLLSKPKSTVLPDGKEMQDVISDQIKLNFGRTQNWQFEIQRFYNDMESKFRNRWGNLQRRVQRNQSDDILNIMVGPSPRVWKTVGDEIIFWKELEHENQIWATFCTWMKAIGDIRKSFKDRQVALDIKSTAWIAEFPVRNKILYSQDNIKTIAEQANRDLMVKLSPPSNEELISLYYKNQAQGSADFIGPAIDIGFRISKFSTSKKMAISLDVAYLLYLSYAKNIAPCFQNQTEDRNKSIVRAYEEDLRLPSNFLIYNRGFENNTEHARFCVHYSGTEYLKGVLGGLKYPIFWINTSEMDSLDAIKDKLYIDGARRDGIEWSALGEFCKKIYDDRKEFIREPFVNHPSTSTSIDDEILKMLQNGHYDNGAANLSYVI